MDQRDCGCLTYLFNKFYPNKLQNDSNPGVFIIQYSTISKIFTGLWGNVYFSYLSVYLQKNQGLILKKIETMREVERYQEAKLLS